MDQAIYFQHSTDEHTIITVSVDDMVIMSKHLKHALKFKDQLCNCFEISDLGNLTWLLGLKVERDRAAHTITLSQEAYINTIVEHFCLENARPASMPMETGEMLNEEQLSTNDNQLQISKDILYQQAIGSLMYAATST